LYWELKVAVPIINGGRVDERGVEGRIVVVVIIELGRKERRER
jgi:hypothetical protein